MQLFICRHGETVENNDGTIQGWTPGILSENGKEQAKVLAVDIKELNPGYIFLSDLGRCVETFAYAQNMKIGTPTRNIFIDWRIRERSFGSLEGKSSDGFDWIDFFSNEETVSKYGEETNRQLFERVRSFLRDMQKIVTEVDDKVLIVTHGGIVNAIKSIEEGPNHGAVKYPNATLIKIDDIKLYENISGAKITDSVHI